MSFIGCGDNPVIAPDGDDNSVSVDSTKAKFVLVESSKENGVWWYTFRATGFFLPGGEQCDHGRFEGQE